MINIHKFSKCMKIFFTVFAALHNHLAFAGYKAQQTFCMIRFWPSLLGSVLDWVGSESLEGLLGRDYSD